MTRTSVMTKYETLRKKAEQAANAIEEKGLVEALTKHGFNALQTARWLGCPYSTLYRTLTKYPDLLSKVGGRGRPKLKQEKKSKKRAA